MSKQSDFVVIVREADAKILVSAKEQNRTPLAPATDEKCRKIIAKLMADRARTSCPGGWPCGLDAVDAPKNCPYAEEIHGIEKLCTCCDGCRRSCADSI